MNIRDFAVCLSSIPGISSRTIIKLVELNKKTISGGKLFFPDDFVKKDVVRNVCCEKKILEIRGACEKINAEIIIYLDRGYSEILREIPDFPPVIYCVGDKSLLESRSISIVGSRRPSPYGIAHTKKIAGILSQYLTIVSGLALGIDGQAHKACLEAGGKTVAVLGTPIDRFYPAANMALAQKIIKSGGLIVSEYPPGFTTEKYNFPLRNRIIAGLSSATLVMEAARQSGSLITANLALEYNREVFALPGSVDSLLSRGTNELVKKGANILLDANDVLEALGMSPLSCMATRIEVSKEERMVLDTLAGGGLAFDKIQNVTKIDVATLSAIMTGLEIKGCILRKASGEYVLLTENIY